MKPLAPIRILLAGWLAVLAACSTSPMSRIDSDRARYETWPLEVQQAILNGEAIKGMTPEQVEMSLGKPSQIVSRSGKGGGDDEVWVYKKGNALSGIGGALRNTGISVGGGSGGVGVGTSVGGGGGGPGPEESEVVFRDGKVSRSDAKR
ncbi:MAG: hypothetical protein V4773_01685 [Verrucomicrobiota bacterium]